MPMKTNRDIEDHQIQINDYEHLKTVSKAEASQLNRNEAVTRPGFGARVVGLAGEGWETSICWAPVANHGDGTKVVAEVLGPDHKLGEKTEGGSSGHAWTLNQATGREANKGGYVRGHLLNNHLGGPSNDPRNLVAIPQSANSKMETHVENRLKSLVHTHKAWVFFKAEVSFDEWQKEGRQKPLPYANQLKFTWQQLKSVEGKPQLLEGTYEERTLNLPNPATLVGNSKKPLTKVDNNDLKKLPLLDEAARADVRWNDIVLDNWDDVKSRKLALDAAEKGFGAEVLRHLCTAPDEEEYAAREELEKEVEALKKKLSGDERESSPSKLASTAAGKVRELRKKRFKEIHKGLKPLLIPQEPSTATSSSSPSTSSSSPSTSSKDRKDRKAQLRNALSADRTLRLIIEQNQLLARQLEAQQKEIEGLKKQLEEKSAGGDGDQAASSSGDGGIGGKRKRGEGNASTSADQGSSSNPAKKSKKEKKKGKEKEKQKKKKKKKKHEKDPQLGDPADRDAHPRGAE